MARRATAVFLACLYTLGVAPAGARASAAPAGGSAHCAADDATSRAASHTSGHVAVRRRGPGGLTHAVEPHEPDPAEVARMEEDLRRRLSARPGGGYVPGADSAAVGPGVPMAPVATATPGTPAASGVPGGAGTATQAGEEIRVPMWVHIIRDGALGLPDSAVTRQVATLNAAYSGSLGGVDTHVRFVLRGVTHTTDRQWFRDPLGHEAAMKKRLHIGGQDTLNLYVAQLGELVLGYATYPYWYADDPDLDGVVIDWRSVPGGPLREFDKGFTAVHEIGHWLGLLHTFENGCQTPGDAVDDTPFEAYPTTGCPARKDSCSATGDDPLHNYMDYGQDRCMREFTSGQAVRIRQMWDAYRRPGAPGALKGQSAATPLTTAQPM
ncbi:zinc metalloprotease [Microbispora sp. NPDC049125]|uniref:zinc metalloprotease n=1 Tax=Microbispora sp. NPDC049125 TaxID=3154929 RepID=UPI003465092F